MEIGMNAAKAVVQGNWKRKLKRWLFNRYFRWEIFDPRPEIPDVEADFWPLHDACKPFTMTSTERLYALYKAVEYIVRCDVPGDFVECGIWRGGSVMMMALTLRKLGAARRIHCFDTFEGMPPPTDVDIKRDTGETAAAILARTEKREGDHFWGIAGLDLARRNIASTGYPLDLVSFHKGRVEETIPGEAPGQIAILRLDTDWYESTQHELVHLYPRLVSGGVLIIDDYGYWQGSTKATDEYLAQSRTKLLLNRIGDQGRIAVKP